MGDFQHIPESVESVGKRTNCGVKLSAKCRMVTRPQSFPRKTLNQLVSLKHLRMGGLLSEQIMYFLLKTAALEVVRRVSRARCPIVWQSIQALQMFCYPPLKWLSRLPLLKSLVKGMQNLSTPLLLLSVTSALSDQVHISKKKSDTTDDSEPRLESSTEDVRIPSESLASHPSDNWLMKLYKELDDQGITIPERITEDDLNRFYVAANGEFSSLLLSVKKTIRWRETFGLLTTEELAKWSHLVFWHGCDQKYRPSLIIRLGLACSSLKYDDRPRFAQAVVSQLEYGILHLVKTEDPRVTVLMDCQGVSAVRFPMQIMRSFSSLVQDHYPNRLALLFVTRLPSVVRVIAQALIQVLKPTTREKVLLLGEMYAKVLADHLQEVPLFLGGRCECQECMKLDLSSHIDNEATGSESLASLASLASCNEPDVEQDVEVEMPWSATCVHVIRTTIIGLLLFWILMAFISVLYDSDNLLTGLDL